MRPTSCLQQALLTTALAINVLMPIGCAPDSRTLHLVPTALHTTSEPVTLPMPVFGGLPFIDVRINGAGPFSMLIDTGCEGVILTPAAADEAGLTAIPRELSFMRGDQVEAVETVPIARVRSLQIGPNDFGGFDALIRSIAGISEFAGSRIDGVIGTPIMKGCVWTLDYPTQRLTLSPVPPADVGDPLPLFNLDSGTAFGVRASCGAVELILMIDTGSSDVLDLAPSDLARLGPDSTPAGRTERFGFLGRSERRLFDIHRDITAGPLTFVTPTVLEARQHSTIGSGALGESRLTLDFAGLHAWITPPPRRASSSRLPRSGRGRRAAH